MSNTNNQEIFQALASKSPGPKIGELLQQNKDSQKFIENVFDMLIAGALPILGTSYEGAYARLPLADKRRMKRKQSWLETGKVSDITSVINRCLAAGGKVNYLSEAGTGTLLSKVILTDRKDVLDFILSKDPNLNQHPLAIDGSIEEDCPPLIAATLRAIDKGNDKHALLTLFKLGVDPNARDMFGSNSLCYSVHNGHFEVSDLLVNYGVDPLYNDNNGNTMMHDYFSSRDEFDQDVVNWMVKNGVDPDHENLEGQSVYDVIDRLIKPTEATRLNAMIRMAIANSQAETLESKTVKTRLAKVGSRL